MSNWSGFGDLDLSSVELGEISKDPVLDVGKYTATCKEAKIETVGDSNNKLVLLFVDDGGAGQFEPTTLLTPVLRHKRLQDDNSNRFWLQRDIKIPISLVMLSRCKVLNVKSSWD